MARRTAGMEPQGSRRWRVLTGPVSVGALVALALGAGAAGCPAETAFDGGTPPGPDPDPLPCPVLSVNGVSPASGTVDVDRVITINGVGFNNGTTVSFVYRPAGGGTETIAGTAVEILSPTQIRATLPAPMAGFYDLRVTRGGGDACADTYTLRDAFRAAPLSSGTFADCTAENIPDFGMMLMGVEPMRIVSADFDCDGDPDAVLGVRPATNLFLEGVPDSDGDGLVNFELRLDVNVGAARLEELLAVDIDGDGDEDLVFADSANKSDGGGLHLLENQGDCSGALFFAEVALPAPPSGFADVAAGDVNGDGRLDLVGVTNELGSGAVYLQSEAGTFASVALGLPIVALASGGTVDVAVFDLEADGLGDIANGAASPGTGSDGESAGLLIHNDGGSFADWTARCGLDGGVTPELKGTTYFIGAGDLDLDGYQDLVWASSGASLVLLNRAGTLAPGDCGFTRDSSATFAGSYSHMTLLVDIDTDGDLDVWDGSSRFLENDGSGGLSAGWPAAVPVGGTAVSYGVATPDLDGDGILDLLVSQNQAPFVQCALQIP